MEHGGGAIEVSSRSDSSKSNPGFCSAMRVMCLLFGGFGSCSVRMGTISSSSVESTIICRAMGVFGLEEMYFWDCGRGVLFLRGVSSGFHTRRIIRDTFGVGL